VASLDLNDRSTRALGHGTLGVRWNHPVPGGEQVPARLRPPRGFADRAANGSHAPRNLGISHERGFFWVHVGCAERLRRFEQEAQATAALFAGRLRLGGRQFGILPQLAVILHVVGCGLSDHLSEIALDDMQSQIDARGKSGGG
jgi:hypothetical protein